MKKKFNRILSVGLSVVMGMAITGCTTVEAPPHMSSVAPVDTTKSPLYVSNFNGGAGFEWLSKLAARFEEILLKPLLKTGKQGGIV